MEVAEQIEILETIARDEQTNPTARVTAIRALRQVAQIVRPTNCMTSLSA